MTALVLSLEINCQMDPRELEAVQPLHLRATDGQWKIVLVTPPPQINDRPLALTGVESKVGCYATAVSCSASYVS